MMRSKRLKTTVVAVAAATAICASFAAPKFMYEREVFAEDDQPAQLSASLLYKLDFSDTTTIGKNTAPGSTFVDATVNKTEANGLAVETNAVKGKNALNFPGGNHENYLSLPVDMFENQNVVTLAGWFKVPSDIGDYTGEIGIHAPTANVAFRSDSRGSFHGDSYLWGIGPVEGIDGDTAVKPVYDAWYHMAYVIDGTAHKFTVYENGERVFTKDIDETFSPAQFNESGAHFYLGQSAYEDNHGDWTGKMSDFRVYAGALDNDSIKAEYDFEISDFKIAEYTFDAGSETTDSVRGYNLRQYKNAPDYADGVMKLNGNSSAQIYDSGEHNRNFFKGVTEMTVSLDIKINSTDYWKRIFELCSNGGNYLTVMAYCDRDGSNMNAVYRYDFLEWQGSADSWVLDGNKYAPTANEWINLTFVLSGEEFSVYEDGMLKSHGNTNKPNFAAMFRDLINTGNFTLGACTYEENPNYIDAEFDNIRIYAKAAKTTEDVRTARAGYPSYALTYNANNGEEQDSTIERLVKKNTETAVEDCTFTKDGHNFIGWNTQADGEGTDYAAGAKIQVDADTELYAQWENVSKYITFDANGGRGDMEVQIIPTGDTANLTEGAFSRSGYTFAGWNTQADGKGTAYADKASISPSADVTLYAQWTAKSYVVTFDANGGTGEMDTLDHTFGTDADLTANAFARHGYTFGGWALTVDGIAVYTDGATINGIGEGNDVTLYATWVIGNFTVTFNANGGTGEMSAQVATAFSTATLKTNAFAKSGHTFQGWATSADGEVVYTDGGSIAMQDDVTLYAVWKAGAPVDPGKPGNTGNNGGDEDSNVGLIVGLTVGGVALAAIAGGLAFYFVKKKKKQ